MVKESPIENSKSVKIEGGDQTGKGDFGFNLACELEVRGEEVVIVSLPNYTSPLGKLLRDVLVNPDKVFPEDISKERRLELTMALFAMNRLEVLDYLKDFLDEGKFLIFDRSAYSNALTIAYFSENHDNYDFLIQKGLWLDSLFIEAFDNDNCVIQLTNENWNPKRGEKGDDAYEEGETQKKAREVYEKIKDIVGEGWKQIPSKVGNKFRERREILRDALSHCADRLGNAFPKPNRTLGGSMSFFDVKDFYKKVYGIDVGERAKEVQEALRSNNKKMIYSSSMDLVNDILKEFNDNRLINFSSEVKSKYREILKEYPELLILMGESLGEDYTNTLWRTIHWEENN